MREYHFALTPAPTLDLCCQGSRFFNVRLLPLAESRKTSGNLRMSIVRMSWQPYFLSGRCSNLPGHRGSRNEFPLHLRANDTLLESQLVVLKSKYVLRLCCRSATTQMRRNWSTLSTTNKNNPGCLLKSNNLYDGIKFGIRAIWLPDCSSLCWSFGKPH